MMEKALVIGGAGLLFSIVFWFGLVSWWRRLNRKRD
jgi:hypothetical protein